MKLKFLCACLSVVFWTGCGQSGNSSSASPATQYAVVVDAGSSSTKIYLYSYTPGDVTSINEICNVNGSDDGIDEAALSNNFTEAADTVVGLVNQMNSCAVANNVYLSSINRASFNLYATAGMRNPNITASQSDGVYAAITNAVSGINYLNIQHVQTLPETSEAVFAWLAANSLEGVFTNQTSTYGTVDMGGASTQIAYEVAAINANYTKTLNGKTYNVFGISYYGLGVNEARDAMNATASVNACYPTGYNASGITGAFDYNNCYAAFTTVTSAKNVNAQMSPIPASTNFLGMSQVYFAANSLDIVSNFSQSTLQTTSYNLCTNNTYAQLQTIYAGTSDEAYVHNLCANSVYLDNLLYNTINFNLQSYSVAPVYRINGTRINWTYGVVIDML